MPLNPDFDQLTTLVINKWLDNMLLDLFSSHHPVWYKMREKGNIVTGGLGIKMVEPIFYPEAAGVGPQVTGTADSWNAVTHSETKNMSASEWTPAQYLIPVSVGEYELDLHGSDTTRVNYIESVMKISVAKFLETLNADFWGDASVAGANGQLKYKLGSLLCYLNGGGASTTTVGTPPALTEQTHAGGGDAVGSSLTNPGNIERNAAGGAFWCTPLLNPNSADLISLTVLNKLITLATRNNDTPDLGVLDRNNYNAFMALLQGQQRFTDSKLADAGFDAIRYRNVDFVFDDNVPAGVGGATTGQAIVMNTDWLTLKVKSMKPQFVQVVDPTRPIKAWLARWVGQLVSGNLGRVHARHANLKWQ